MANIQLPREDPVPINEKKEGAYYDDCGSCGKRDIDRRFKIGGTTGRGAEYLDAAIYHCDPRGGGCGQNWARTTAQGQAVDHARGIRSKWLTRSALRGTAHSAPSERFRSRYELIDWTK